MSDALWGVVIGGAIASLGPIASLIADTKRWKIERKLEQLREERARLERLISETLPQLGEAMLKNNYPSHMSSDIVALMPKAVADRFMTWMKEKPKDELKGKHAFFDMALEMKKCVADIDRKISALLDSA
jgi:hypothetical protein